MAERDAVCFAGFNIEWFYAKSDREYTKGMRKYRYFDGIVRSGMSDLHGSFREESRKEQTK